MIVLFFCSVVPLSLAFSFSSKENQFDLVLGQNCAYILRPLCQKREGRNIYLAHLEQMLSVTLACGSGW